MKTIGNWYCYKPTPEEWKIYLKHRKEKIIEDHEKRMRIIQKLKYMINPF